MQPESTEERLAELEEKWLKGTITVSEAEEYASWYNAHQGDPLYLPEAFAGSREEHRKRMLRNINAAKDKGF
ncbi:MAG: hypothetical protein P4L51_02870 [Puia sp.]|nr:hypothetical protein [Puia sp.]